MRTALANLVHRHAPEWAWRALPLPARLWIFAHADWLRGPR